MSTDVPTPDRIAMSQKERDALKVLHGVLRGERSQAEAARLLDLSTRHVRRLQRKRAAGADPALVPGLRARAALASGSWCRWTPPSTTGWRAAAKTWS